MPGPLNLSKPVPPRCLSSLHIHLPTYSENMDRLRAVSSHLAGGDAVSKLAAKHPDDGERGTGWGQ